MIAALPAAAVGLALPPSYSSVDRAQPGRICCGPKMLAPMRTSLAILLALTACRGAKPDDGGIVGMIDGSVEVAIDAGPTLQEPVVWWISSDSHVGQPNNYVNQLATAVDDVNSLEISHHAVILGDAIDETASDPAAEWTRLEGKMNQLVHGWTYVLGNHDITGRWPTNPGPITSPNWFSEIVNGVRIIGISDENISVQSREDQRDLQMSAAQMDWVKDTLNADPGIPTIFLSHQHLGRIAFYRDWIEPNIDKYNIVYWLHGHLHNWRFVSNQDDHGFSRLSVGGVLLDSESAFMTIEDLGGRAKISFRFRNHATEEWIPDGAELRGSTSPFLVNYGQYEKEVATGPDPSCERGILADGVCCADQCGSCGGAGCGQRSGGGMNCCANVIIESERRCAEYAPPCVM
jgi:hypothetical protein